MRVNKTLNLVMSVILTMTFFLLLAANVSAVTYGQPGDHCGATADPACRSDLVCLYNACVANPFAPCSSSADCAGTVTNLMGCYDSQCLGRHAYPCQNDALIPIREAPECAPDFHCDISGTIGYFYCEHNHECGDGVVESGETCELPNTINNNYCPQDDDACLGAKLGTRDAFGNCDSACGCVYDPFNYRCVAGQCGATCDSNDDCAPKCDGNVYNYAGTCGENSCACSYSSENCDLKDGWYNTTNTQWINTGVCTEKQQKQQKYRDYSCSLPNGCTYTETDSRWVDTGNTRNKPDGTVCNDGLFCTTPDVCTNGICGGIARDCSDNLFCTINERCDEVNDRCTSDQKSCSAFNISSIATCDNNPDSIHYTWDFRMWFTSVCDENNDKCTTGNEDISHSCDIDRCGAICEVNADCDDQNIYTTDICLADCTCKHDWLPYCGDNIINQVSETCELPSTSNNAYCTQSTSQCQGAKLGTRDAFGNCNSVCGCVPDQFNYQCVLGQCGATCAVNADCDDGNIHTTDVCDTASCSCKHDDLPYCGDNIINQLTETCELPSTSNNAYCSQTTTGTCEGNKLGTRDAFGNCNSVCGCVPDQFNYQCVPGQCQAECNDDSDCNDGNVHTTDSCNMQTCGCEHQDLPYCGNNVINDGETCELPSTSNNAYCSQTNTTCSGFKLGVRDLFGNCNAACGCAEDDFSYTCVKDECGATCSVDADCADFCEGDIKHFSKTCDLTSSCSCTAGQSFNCSSLDGWYDTNETQWISTGACTEKQQKKQEYRDYVCTASTAVDCTFTVNETKWIDTTNTRNKANGTSCDDGLFCTDNDVCTEGQCGGTSKDCSGFNIVKIETCDNNPDSFHFTWDFRNEFISVCDENKDKCTEGNETITHTCDMARCNAECVEDSDCYDKNPNTIDTCVVADCVCLYTPISQVSSSSGSGSRRSGGGGSSVSISTWTCSEWAQCTDGKQERICTQSSISKTEVQDCQAVIPTNAGTVSLAIQPSDDSDDLAVEAAALNENVAANSEVAESNDNAVASVLGMDSITGYVVGNNPSGKVAVTGIAFLVLGCVLLAFAFFRK